MTIKVSILTTSDRSFSGEREDLSGPELKAYCKSLDWEVVQVGIVPDEIEAIIEKLTSWVDHSEQNIVLTTGGTGFTPRDVTPEATKAVIEKDVPGLAEAMRLASAQKTAHAWLSRAVVGIRKDELIINLPGSPKAAVENLQAIASILPHAVELLQNCKDAEKHH